MTQRIRVAIIGGGGFVGQNVAVALSLKNAKILLIDSIDCPRDLENLENATFQKINITDAEKIKSSFKEFKPTVVIHLASMGMSGSAMLSKHCKVVNVLGTSNLLDICCELDIVNFIYTSSYNVAFGGQEIVNGSETLPYFPVELHSDQYSATKSQAEQLVLASNGKTTKAGKTLKTASIRPAAIYGEKEMRHLPRIVKHMDNGLFVFRIGDATVDWVHVDNLVRVYLVLFICKVRSICLFLEVLFLFIYLFV
jgi:nucleoside-diphosphate-sugar epimerase